MQEYRFEVYHDSDMDNYYALLFIPAYSFEEAWDKVELLVDTDCNNIRHVAGHVVVSEKVYDDLPF